MNEFKGTKGPWFISNETDICNANSDKLGGGIIAQVYDGRDTHVSEMDENIAKANALLISKAPELLRTVMRLVERLEENNLGELWAVKMAKELIKESTEL